MAQKPMIQIQCERCPRTELREMLPEEQDGLDGDETPKFAASFRYGEESMQEVRFADLCEPCADTVAKHLAAIGKKVGKESPKRGTK